MQTTLGKVDPKTLKLSKEVNEVSCISLIESIKSQGLLHPPSIKDNLEVIIGDKRVRAAQLIGLTSIDVKIYPSNLTQDVYKILSLHENLKRDNMLWYESCVMEAQLHAL